MSILSIEAVEKSWFGRKLLDRVSLRLDKGDKLALIGENGTGKTTLFKLIMGQESIDAGRIVLASGTVVGYLSQTPEVVRSETETALDHPALQEAEAKMRRLEHEIADAHAADEHAASDKNIDDVLAAYSQAMARFEALGGYDYAPRLAQILSGLGFKGESLDQPLRSLSGGERMRVQMARILISEPDLLMLDEPTNHLDVSGIEWLEDYLTRFGGTVLFISHDRSFIDACATNVAELAGSKIQVYRGNYSKYLEQKAIEDDFARLEIKRLGEAVKRESEVAQTMLSHRKMSSYHSREKKVMKLSAALEEARGKLKAGPGRMNFHFIPKERDGDPKRTILKAEGLGMAYGDRVLFEGLDFSLGAQEHLVLAGPNGCGKTTLLHILQGETEGFSGQVQVSAGIRYAAMGQYVPFEDETLTVLEELAARSDLPEGELRSRLARFGFTDVTVFKEIHVLSGGERARLYLCCLLEEEPDLLYLDEPTNHLDIHSRDILEQALADFTGAILAVSHDRFFIDRIASEILGFVEGEVLPFFNYKQYRRAAREAQIEAIARLSEQRLAQRQEKAEAAERQNRQAGINPAEIRRRNAKRQETMNGLERQMAELEAEKEAIESSLDETTGRDTYLRLAEIMETYEAAQDRYLELAIEAEEA